MGDCRHNWPAEAPPTVPTPNRPKPIGGPAEPAEAHASTACVARGLAVLHLEPHVALGGGVAPYPPPLTRDDWRSDWAGDWAAPGAWGGAVLYRLASHAPVRLQHQGPGTICAGGLADVLEECPAVLLLSLLTALRLDVGNGVVVCDPPV